MSAMDGKIRKTKFDFIIEAMAFMAGVLIFAVTFFVSGSAVIRYLGFRPPMWVLQYTEYALLWFTFLGAAWLLREDGHIRIDTLLSRFRSKTRRKVDTVNNILGLIVSLVIFYFGTLYTIDLVQRGIMEVKGVTVPLAPFFAVIPLGGLTLSIQFVLNIINDLKKNKHLKRESI